MLIAMVMTAYGQQARHAANQLFNGKAVTTQPYLGPSLEGLRVFTLRFPLLQSCTVLFCLYILRNGAISRI